MDKRGAQNLNELVIISGKGGTGKTSLAASFAVLAGNAVVADCDVDASDLHLILSPKVVERHEFASGYQAVISQRRCTAFGLCQTYCRFDAVRVTGETPSKQIYKIDPISCEGCGVCEEICPESAIYLVERVCGEWMVSETRSGPMIHARLGVAAENSGKMVSIIRREARRIAADQGRSLVIVDGPPGIGCPVISSITSASLLLAVTEPTVSGEHDLNRILELAGHFEIPTAVCVNKWDLNTEMTDGIEDMARRAGTRIAGRICYDPSVTHAQMQELAVVELNSCAGADIRNIWTDLMHFDTAAGTGRNSINGSRNRQVIDP